GTRFRLQECHCDHRYNFHSTADQSRSALVLSISPQLHESSARRYRYRLTARKEFGIQAVGRYATGPRGDRINLQQGLWYNVASVVWETIPNVGKRDMAKALLSAL